MKASPITSTFTSYATTRWVVHGFAVVPCLNPLFPSNSHQASKENENWTTFDQQASLEVKSFFGFEHVVERLAVKHYSANVKKGEEIIEFHVAELAQEGVTYLAPFEDPLPLNKKNGVMNGTSAETAAAALGSRAANGSQRVHGNEHCASDLEAEGEVGGGGGGGGGGQEVMVPFSALSSILSPL